MGSGLEVSRTSEKDERTSVVTGVVRPQFA